MSASSAHHASRMVSPSAIMMRVEVGSAAPLSAKSGANSGTTTVSNRTMEATATMSTSAG